MPFSFSENWDSVTAPALPAGWNIDAQLITSTTQFLSSPNSLVLNAGGGTKYYGVWNTADPDAGATMDITNYVFVDTSAITGLYKAGITLRCSASTMNNTSTSCYWVTISFNNAFSGPHVQFDKIVNGTVTTLGSVTCNDTFLLRGAWYAIRVISSGLNIFNVRVTRVSDGYTMDSAGYTSASVVDAISGLSAPDIASGSYYGVAMGANSSGKIFIDSLNGTTSGSMVVIPPRRPVVVKLPFEFYHPE